MNETGSLSQIAENFPGNAKPYSAASGIRSKGTTKANTIYDHKSKTNFNAYSSGLNSKMKLPPAGSSAAKYNTNQ